MQRSGILPHLGDPHPPGTQAQIGPVALALAPRLLLTLQAVVCGALTILFLQDSEPSDDFNKSCLDFYSFFYCHSLLDKDSVLQGSKC